MIPRTRFVIISVVGLSGVLALVLAHAANWAATALGLPTPPLVAGLSLTLPDAVGYLAAVAVAAAVLKNPTTRALAHEVVDELARASWPSRQETVRATWIVLCTVAVCALYLGVLDAAWLSLTDSLMAPPSAPPLTDTAAH